MHLCTHSSSSARAGHTLNCCHPWASRWFYFIYLRKYMCRDTCGDQRTICGFSSLLSPCGSQGLTSDHQQVLPPPGPSTRPSRWPVLHMEDLHTPSARILLDSQSLLGTCVAPLAPGLPCWGDSENSNCCLYSVGSTGDNNPNTSFWTQLFR